MYISINKRKESLSLPACAMWSHSCLDFKGALDFHQNFACLQEKKIENRVGNLQPMSMPFSSYTAEIQQQSTEIRSFDCFYKKYQSKILQ